MSKVYVDGLYLELTEELEAQLGRVDIPESDETTESVDTAKALAEGLSTATTLAQVRSAAKSALGGDSE
ncbi:MAG: hypothetical protein J1F23_08475 [Oscillospiraceae bacterium]|nr:hypothetical protein [Oscillospiraceae bacterium]